MQIHDIYDDILINPSREQFLRLLRSTNSNVARALVDSHGDFYVFDAYRLLHSEIRRKFDLASSTRHVLSLSSLYAFPDVLAVRLHVVDDGEEYPQYSKYARNNRNIRRVYGRNVKVIDIHGEP